MEESKVSGTFKRLQDAGDAHEGQDRQRSQIEGKPSVAKADSKKEGKQEGKEVAKEEKKETEEEKEERRLKLSQRLGISLCVLYLIYEVLSVVFVTIYFYYLFGIYMSIGFAIFVFVCYLRSLAAFMALKLNFSTPEVVFKKWKDYRDLFYWSIALMFLLIVLGMCLYSLRIPALSLVLVQTFLIICGVDLALFLAMGVATAFHISRLLRHAPA